MISADEAWKKVKSGALLVDNRTADEVADGTFSAAVHIPYDQVEAQLAKLGPDKNREIVLYCRSGRRSGIARDRLTALGYSKVFNAGGFDDLARVRPTEYGLK